MEGSATVLTLRGACTGRGVPLPAGARAALACGAVAATERTCALRPAARPSATALGWSARRDRVSGYSPSTNLRRPRGPLLPRQQFGRRPTRGVKAVRALRLVRPFVPAAAWTCLFQIAEPSVPSRPFSATDDPKREELLSPRQRAGTRGGGLPRSRRAKRPWFPALAPEPGAAATGHSRAPSRDTWDTCTEPRAGCLRTLTSKLRAGQEDQNSKPNASGGEGLPRACSGRRPPDRRTAWNEEVRNTKASFNGDFSRKPVSFPGNDLNLTSVHRKWTQRWKNKLPLEEGQGTRSENSSEAGNDGCSSPRSRPSLEKLWEQEQHSTAQTPAGRLSPRALRATTESKNLKTGDRGGLEAHQTNLECLPERENPLWVPKRV